MKKGILYTIIISIVTASLCGCSYDMDKNKVHIKVKHKQYIDAYKTTDKIKIIRDGKEEEINYSQDHPEEYILTVECGNKILDIHKKSLYDMTEVGDDIKIDKDYLQEISNYSSVMK